MSKAAVSSRVFAVYLFIVGAGLVLAPNLLLSLFRTCGSTWWAFSPS
jgi:hypothetical protein